MNLRTTDFSDPSSRAELSHVEDSRMTVDAGRLRMDIRSEADAGLNHTLVFSGGESSSITVIDHREQSYSVIDRESIAALGNEMRILTQTTALRIQSLPPEQRVIVQKMLESQLGKARGKPPLPPGTVIRTSDRDVVSGLSCVKYEVFSDGKKRREVWVAPSSEVRGGGAALAVLREMSDFFSTLMVSFEEMAAGLGGDFRLGRHPFEDLRRMDGFPVLSRNFAGGRVKTEIVLLSVEQQQLDPSDFEPPPGYRPAAISLP